MQQIDASGNALVLLPLLLFSIMRSKSKPWCMHVVQDALPVVDQVKLVLLLYPRFVLPVDFLTALL